MGPARETDIAGLVPYMTHLLIIVSSTDSARFEYLKHVFASQRAFTRATVEVIYDRRVGERRQLQKPVALERRRRERRMRHSVAKDLEAFGWAVVRH